MNFDLAGLAVTNAAVLRIVNANVPGAVQNRLYLLLTGSHRFPQQTTGSKGYGMGLKMFHH